MVSSQDRIPLAPQPAEDTQKKIPLSPKAKQAVAFAAFVSSLTAATLGYDVGIVAAAIEYISDSMNLNHSQTQMVVGSLNFISAFGTLIAGVTADAFGRKTTVWICCVFYTIGTALMTFAPNYEFLLMGRIVTGLGVGVSFVVVPVYISEITPSEYRGMLTTCFDVSINVGILLGYLAGYAIVVFGRALDDEFKWRLMLGLGGLLPAVVMASLVKLPESPRWLMSRGREAEATTMLAAFYGDAKVAEQTIRDIKRVMQEDAGVVVSEVEVVEDTATDNPLVEVEGGRGSSSSDTRSPGETPDQDMSGGDPAKRSGDDQDGSNQRGTGKSTVVTVSPPLTWREVLWIDPLPPSDAYLRRVILIVAGLGFWQQATGSEAVLYYSGSFLEQAGLDSREERLMGYVAIGLCKLIPEALVMLIVDQSGRRPLLVGSSVGVTLAMFALAAAFSSSATSGGLVIGLLCFYMVTFSMGMGPVTWVLSAEMLPSRARAKGMTMCSFINRLVSGSVALTVLTTSDALGFGGFFLLYSCIAALATVWYWFYVPETKGKTLEEITATFRGEDEVRNSTTENARHHRVSSASNSDGGDDNDASAASRGDTRKPISTANGDSNGGDI
mmetsp:Transcript_59398/g.112103  ORF Transcript_59398/g.112103 Transcript_59398/m.112103 type:complete len:613 (+) Transcript_59398:128-1966(+)